MKSVILSCALILISGFQAKADTEGTRGGGNDAALSLQQAAQRAVRAFKTELVQAGVNPAAVENVIAQAKIVVVSEKLSVSIDGISQPSVAVNERGLMRIMLNGDDWNRINNPKLQEALALHEFLSLLGVEASGKYPLSQLYLSKLGDEGKIAFSCELGDDSYNKIILTPSDGSWPIKDPFQGSMTIDFGGYRFGGMLLGSYRYAAADKLSFVVSSAGDGESVVVGSISKLDTAKPVLRVKRAPYFVSNKDKDVPCVMVGAH